MRDDRTSWSSLGTEVNENKGYDSPDRFKVVRL